MKHQTIVVIVILISIIAATMIYDFNQLEHIEGTVL